MHPSILQFPDPHKILDYDPYSGRIRHQSVIVVDRMIEILDLVV